MPEALLPFQKLQYEFAGYIRDPEHNAPPAGIEKRRIDMYRELIFNNIEDFLATNFPVLNRISETEWWQALVSDFFARHKSHSPYFIDIAEEFLSYLQNERENTSGDPPFLLELAHYEWVELALVNSDCETPEHDSALQEDPLSHVCKVSDLAWVLAYRFPVHKISPDFLPDTEPDEPTYLVVYRDQDDNVRFLEINPITHRLLELIREDHGKTPRELLTQIAEELQHPDPEIVVKGGTEILGNLIDRRMIYRK